MRVKLVAVAVEEDRAAVRAAILALQRVLLASDGLNAPATHWCGVFGVLMPVLRRRATSASRASGRRKAIAGATLGWACRGREAFCSTCRRC